MDGIILLGIVVALGALVKVKRAFIFTKFKHLLLSKIVFYIVMAIMTLIGLAALASNSDRSIYYRHNPLTIIFQVLVVFAPYYIASIAFSAHLAKKYRMFLKKGRPTTIDHIASVVKRKDLDEVKYELQSLIDRKYIRGFSVNHETNAITPVAVKAAVQELSQTMNKTISAFKKSGASPTSTCKGCGATNTSPDATNCEFCGSPL